MPDRFEPYPNYQDSGTCYLREVPSTWEIKQLKRSVEGCVNGVWGQEPTEDSDDIVVIRVADFDRPRLGVSDVNFTRRAIPEKDRVRRRLRRGDLLLEKSGGGENQQVGQVVLFDADMEAVTSNFVARLRPLHGIDSRYLNYTFSSLYRDRMNTCSIKQNTGIQNLDSNAYLAEQWAFPSEDEQKQIAAFLDYETAKIDALIAMQQQLIALLGEKRQAVISHAVTKGLNPDAPMRDSGIEWLGEVPEHWTVLAYRHLVKRVVVGIAEAATHAYAETGVPIVRSTNIKTGVIDQSKMLFVKPSFADKLVSKALLAGDIVTTRTGANVGVSAVVPESLHLSQCFTLVVSTPNDESNSEFYRHFINSEAGKCYIDLTAWGSGQPNISVPIIQEMHTVAPPLQEQNAIVAFVEQEGQKFAVLISKAEAAVELLQERRTALISAAVTGKIDVRGWKPPSSARMKETEMEVA